MAITREILNSHPVSTLKKEVAKTNIKGYSKMKKAEVVELMMKNKDKFGHIRKKGEASASKSPPKSQAQNLLASYKPKAPLTATVENKPKKTIFEEFEEKQKKKKKFKKDYHLL